MLVVEGKAGGVKLVKDLNTLENEIKEMFGKKINYSSNWPRGKRSQKTLC